MAQARDRLDFDYSEWLEGQNDDNMRFEKEVAAILDLQSYWHLKPQLIILRRENDGTETPAD